MASLVDAFDYHEELLRVLTRNHQSTDVSKKFQSHQPNAEKAKYALTLLKTHNLIPKLPLRQPKNDEWSVKFRKKGNLYFGARNFFMALEMYNKSISFAERESENLSIGYANRSAVYFEWQLYVKCLENIKLAKDANYPERLAAKLEKRSAQCQERNKPAKPKSKKVKLLVPKLTYPRHDKVPFIAECLELVENETFGRHVIAKHDLKAGDIIALEKPFEVALLPEYKYRRCSNCLNENELSLIPCPACTSTMFCSPQCLSAGYDRFHKYECPIIDALYKLFTKIYLMATRLVLTTIEEFKTMEVLETVIQEIGEKDTNSFLLTYNNKAAGGCDRKEMFKNVFSLATNEEKRTNSEMFQRGVLVAILYDLFIENTELKGLLEKDSHKDMFMNLLFKYAQSSSTNFHTLGALERINAEEVDTQSFGSAVFPFCSMLNHSCTPNVVRICYKTSQVAVVVYRHIKKGGQLLDCYGFHHCLSPKVERQKELESQYKFNCACEACINDFGSYQQLPYPSTVPGCIKQDDIEQLQLLDFKTAMNNFKKYMTFLEKYDRYYPCQQVSSVQESLVRSFEICFGNISLNTKLEV